jgi:hypothetical protein
MYSSYNIRDQMGRKKKKIQFNLTSAIEIPLHNLLQRTLTM